MNPTHDKGVAASPGGIVKRSLAMAFLGCGATIAKACGLDDATQTPPVLRDSPVAHS